MSEGVHAVVLNDEDSEWLKNLAVNRERMNVLFAKRRRGEITFKSIGEQVGITPTRVSQLFKKNDRKISLSAVRGALACLHAAGVIRVRL